MNFKLDEFNCKCGKNKMDKDFLSKLNQARIISGIPYIITSGYRCQRHNKAVGGKSTSSHMKGLACDILADTSRKRSLILSGLIKAGFTRIGIGYNFIHVDNDKNKSQNVVWLY